MQCNAYKQCCCARGSSAASAGRPRLTQQCCTSPHLQVYYVAQVQEADADVGDGSAFREPATILRGPFDAQQPEVMAALGQLSKVHYVYVCRKSPALMARALKAAEAQRQQEAALLAAQAGQQAAAGSAGDEETETDDEGEEAVVVVDRKAAQECS